MKIAALCIGRPTLLAGRKAKTGIVKEPVRSGVVVDAHGLLGDAVCNRKHHGGPDQAVYGLGSVDLEAWSQRLGRMIEPGLFGENIVIDKVDSRTIAVGDRFDTGSVLLEVTSTRIPCATLSARMNDPQFARCFNEMERPGFYFRVLRPGTMAEGDGVTYSPFTGERVTMPDMLARSVKALTADERRRYRSVPVSERIRAQLDATEPAPRNAKSISSQSGIALTSDNAAKQEML